MVRARCDSGGEGQRGAWVRTWSGAHGGRTWRCWCYVRGSYHEGSSGARDPCPRVS
ncbi:hypothetical protein V6Z12_A12G148700 [Gossypium hirsutum]